jgi:hypothetical protein
MTGVLNALVGTASIERRTVTLGVTGSTVGYDVTIGSINSTTLRTVTIVTLRSGTTYDVWIDLEGTTSQSYFKRIRIQDGSGTLQTLESSAATFSNPTGTQSRWVWGDGSPRFWDTTDSGETKTVQFFF